MVGLTSSPQFDTRGIEVRLMSGESLLEASCREEVRRRKGGVFQEDTGVKGIHFLNGLFPDTGKPPASVILLSIIGQASTLVPIG